MDDFIKFIEKAGKMELDLSRPVSSFEVAMFIGAVLFAIIVIIFLWGMIDVNVFFFHIYFEREFLYYTKQEELRI